MSDLECPVCFNSLWIINTPCNHNICIQCLIKLRKDECPTCRCKVYNQLPIEFQRIMTVYKPNEINVTHNIEDVLNINNYEEFPDLYNRI